MKSSSTKSGVARKLIPSPSMIVALLALAVALSGTAYAAAKINGKNIKKGTVASKQIKDKSLLGKDIKDGTVASADIADGAVNGAKIADGSVAAADLAAGTVVPPPIGTATSSTAYAIPGAAFSDVPGMTLDYTAPPGTTKLIITYSAECEVEHAADSQYISTQIHVDGAEAQPAFVGLYDYKFCMTDTIDNYAQTVGASMTRVISAGPGVHQIKIRAAEFIAANGELDDMTLTVVPSS